MEVRRPGRPRATGSTPGDVSGREEILTAAADLFTNQGYTRTSTRAIADAVGIRQSSIYHHFPSKEDILEVLLESTVAASIVLSRRLVGSLPVVEGEIGPEAGLERAGRLFALAVHDGTQWCSAEWNIGVLFQLPETRHTRFESFHAQRRELREAYEKLSPRPECEGLGHLVFRLVESLITVRADGLLEPDSPMQTARAALGMIGYGIEAEHRAGPFLNEMGL